MSWSLFDRSPELNAAKTEFLWSSLGRRVDQVPSTPIRAGTDSISPASSVRNLGIYLDSDMTSPKILHDNSCL